MHRFSVLLLVVCLLASGWGARSPIAATAVQAATMQSDGQTYVSPTYGYRLAWNASWIVDQESSDGGVDYLVLSNGLTTLEFTGMAAFEGNPSICLNAIRGYILTSPDFSNVQPLNDANGKAIAGQEPARAWAALSFLATAPDGTVIDLAGYLECRTLVPGEAVLGVVATMPLMLYNDQIPLIEQVTNTLEIPSPGETGPAFVSGSWRIAVVSGALVRSLDKIGLEATAGSKWVVQVADVTNWGEQDATFPVADLRLVLTDPTVKPLSPHGTMTKRVARELDAEPRDYKQGVPIGVNQTVRVSIVFKVEEDAQLTGLSLNGAMVDLVWLPHTLTSGDQLPPVLGPPPFTEALVLNVLSGDRLEVELPDGSTDTVALLYVDPPVNDECYAKEATRRLKKLVERSNGTVWLETEPYQGGALYWSQASRETEMYVWVKDPKGRWVLGNHDLVAHGFAQQLASRTQSRFGGWLAAGERQARAEKTGLWEACTAPHGEPVTSQAEPSPTAVESSSDAATSADPTTPTAKPTSLDRSKITLVFLEKGFDLLGRATGSRSVWKFPRPDSRVGLTDPWPQFSG